MNRIVIVHHHLLPGGVTRIIKSQVKSLVRNSDSGIFPIIISGTQPSEKNLDIRLKDIIISREINYLPAGLSAEKLDKRKRGIEAVLYKHTTKEDIIHIHNLNLGKNALLNLIVYEMAVQGYRILNHCHDFMEEGRFKNYEQLQYVIETVYGQDLKKVLYPNLPNYFWAVINQRDKKVLCKARIPKVRIKHLMNPVIENSAGGPSALTRKQVCKNLGIKKHEKMLLYPVRGIRRKNLGEVLLLSVLLKGAGRWLISAAPDNPEEQASYNFWESTASQLNLPLVFGAAALADYSDLVFHADEMITTSVLEGFGMGFLEPWISGKTLFGRDIPEITTDFKKLDIDLPRMYSSLDIPLEYIWDVNGLVEDYYSYISGAFRKLGFGVPGDLRMKIQKAKIKKRTMDFADLHNVRQKKLIELAVGNDRIRRSLGRRLKLKSIYTRRSKTIQKRNASLIRCKLNLGNYASKLLTIYNQMIKSDNISRTGHVQSKSEVSGFFLDPSRFRLILR